jgi:hypothetical protein
VSQLNSNLKTSEDVLTCLLVQKYAPVQWLPVQSHRTCDILRSGMVLGCLAAKMYNIHPALKGLLCGLPLLPWSDG